MGASQIPTTDLVMDGMASGELASGPFAKIRRQMLRLAAPITRRSKPRDQIFGSEVASDLRAWYVAAREVLTQIAPEDLAAIEEAERWLPNHVLASPAPGACVVGDAGVGKSTLLNALVSPGDPILPAGGIGPHTAASIAVVESPRPFVQIQYEGRDRIRSLYQGVRTRDSSALGKSRLLLCGNQFADVDATRLLLLFDDCLKDAAEGVQRSTVEEACARRLRDVVLRDPAGGSVRLEIEAGREVLARELEVHAVGSLAPLTKSIEIGWRSSLLESGLCLVDLPGFGIANDSHKARSSEGVACARSVLWVVDRAGPTDAVLGELAKCGLIERLGRDPDDRRAPHLSIAVTKLDMIAADERRRSRSSRSSFEDALQHVRKAATSRIRDQVREILGASFDDMTERKRASDRIDVFSLAPVEYQRLAACDDEEPPRVQNAHSTGVPSLSAHLREQAMLTRLHSTSVLSSLIDRCSSGFRRRKWRPVLHDLKAALHSMTCTPESANGCSSERA